MVSTHTVVGSILSNASNEHRMIMQCMEELIANALPLGIKKKCELQVHHLIAENGKWNDHIRFFPFTEDVKKNTKTILYLGGNTDAADAARLKQLLPNLAKVHILEPVPEFFSPLKKNMAGKEWAELYNVGLGFSSRVVKLAKSSLDGQGTFVMSGKESKDAFTSLKILSPKDFFASVPNLNATAPFLHVNCEGCEYEVFEAFIQEKILGIFSVIQISFHYYSGVTHPFSRYCHIRTALSQLYQMDPGGIAFGWERWVRKK